MAFSSSTVTIGYNTKKSDYDRLLDNTIYNKGLHTSDLILSDRGKANITLSNYDNDSAPDVKAGSVFDNNGVMIEVTSDATPTGYAGMTSDETFFLYYDESGTAFTYSNTVPTWSDALQGWYNGNDRAFFSMYKDSGGTLYEVKIKLNGQTAKDRSWFVQDIQLTTKTGGEIYSALAGYLPFNGDKLSVNITLFGSPDTIYFGLERTSATTIRMDKGDAASTFTKSDGTGSITIGTFL